MAKKLCLAFCIFIACDIALGQLAMRISPAPDATTGEQAFRIPSDVYHHDLAKRADAQGTWGPHTYRMLTNSLGFKDASVREVPLKAERHRVLLLGDSFTEARQVDIADTYWKRVETKLSVDSQLRGRQVEVLNFGVGGYGTSQELLTLEMHVLGFAPNVVMPSSIGAGAFRKPNAFGAALLNKASCATEATASNRAPPTRPI